MEQKKQAFSSHLKKLTDSDFKRLGNLISNRLGIKMPSEKKILLEGRLNKHIRELELETFKEYVDLIFRNNENSSIVKRMFDLITTNKTDFFREPIHFEYLTNDFLPDYLCNVDNKYTLKIWCAGCSSGEEVYTLAIVLAKYKETHFGFDFSIMGTDISEKVLNEATLSVYPENRIQHIPFDIKKKYFLKSKDKDKKLVRISPELRAKTSFQRHNLMDDNYSSFEEFDIIFCRNTLIYFDQPTQTAVVNKLFSRLKRGGALFLGHSETIYNIKYIYIQIKPSVYIQQ
jgi:chemotaxis protein methyltransferase CheR